jgi:glycine/D-amino acid oxidase-like deaminating enzyme
MESDSPYWLTDALRARSLGAIEQLEGNLRFDVCIVGGGYTGLWTALRVREAAPELRVAVVEAEFCGSGASGRNGGLVASWWREYPEMRSLFGDAAALHLVDASVTAIDEIGAFCAERELDVHFRQQGYIWAPSNQKQDAQRIRSLLEENAALAHAESQMQALPKEDVRRRIGSPVFEDGVLMPHGATLQPALLALGLRREAIRSGVKIYEHSRMSALDRRSRTVRTERGSITAETVVLAINAWAARLPEVRLRILPVSSHVIVTEPAEDAIRRIGWTNGEGFSDGRTLVHYGQVTRDWRVVFGRGGGAIGALGRVPARVLWQPSLAQTIVADFRRFFPDLRSVPIAASWGGAVDRGVRYLPFFAPLGDSDRILLGAGFSGKGIVPCFLGGRILAGLILEEQNEWTACPLVGYPDRIFPPEPFRYLGASVVRRAIARQERIEDDNRKPGRILQQMSRFAWFSLPRPPRVRWRTAK